MSVQLILMPYEKGVSPPPPLTMEQRENLRRMFCESDERPSFAELSEKTGIGIRTIHHRASVDGWLEQRAAHMDRKHLAARAEGLVAEAASRVNQPLIDNFASAALALLERVTLEMLRLTDETKPSSNVQVLSSASFVLLNTANACKALGLVGLPKALADVGKEANGRWNPQMLSQLNVTIQNMTEKAKAAATDVAADLVG